MKLHNNKDEFRALVSATAKALNLPEHVVEKDYWVTKVLHNLSQYKYKEYVVFKGGTSLSKGHKLIHRFSEDVDLALHPNGIGEGKIHKKEGEALHRVVSSLKDSTFTDEKEGKESEGKRYKRVYLFPQNFSYPENSPIHGKIILEVNSFATPAPSEKVQIISLVGEHLAANGGGDALKELNLENFAVDSLSPERAFCEKLLALRRASHRGGDFFNARIRHVYDVHALAGSPRIAAFMKNQKVFFDMLNTCHADDELNQKISTTVANDFKSFSIFSKPLDVITTSRVAYEGLKNITFNNSLPDFKEIEATFNQIIKTLNGFQFDISDKKDIR
jgi:hypothetical protein